MEAKAMRVEGLLRVADAGAVLCNLGECLMAGEIAVAREGVLVRLAPGRLAQVSFKAKSRAGKGKLGLKLEWSAAPGKDGDMESFPQLAVMHGVRVGPGEIVAPKLLKKLAAKGRVSAPRVAALLADLAMGFGTGRADIVGEKGLVSMSPGDTVAASLKLKAGEKGQRLSLKLFWGPDVRGETSDVTAFFTPPRQGVVAPGGVPGSACKNIFDGPQRPGESESGGVDPARMWERAQAAGRRDEAEAVAVREQAGSPAMRPEAGSLAMRPEAGSLATRPESASPAIRPEPALPSLRTEGAAPAAAEAKPTPPAPASAATKPAPATGPAPKSASRAKPRSSAKKASPAQPATGKASAKPSAKKPAPAKKAAPAKTPAKGK